MPENPHRDCYRCGNGKSTGLFRARPGGLAVRLCAGCIRRGDSPTEPAAVLDHFDWAPSAPVPHANGLRTWWLLEAELDRPHLEATLGRSATLERMWGVIRDRLVVAIEADRVARSPRSRATKRLQIDSLLVKYPGWADRRVAKLIGVSHTLVGRRRGELARVGLLEPRAVLPISLKNATPQNSLLSLSLSQNSVSSTGGGLYNSGRARTQLGVMKGVGVSRDESKSLCSETKADGSPCRAYATATGRCAGHEGLGVGSDPVAAQVLSTESRSAAAKHRKLSARDHLAAKLEEKAETLVNAAVKAAEDGDWRAFSWLYETVYGKPTERREVTSINSEVSELSPSDRASLANSALAALSDADRTALLARRPRLKLLAAADSPA